ncbi:MAG: PLP-dependent transferase, partial [Clostridia bacterium]|nr:PLP-dependent transferase [Clostridia bacterium]
MKSKTPICDFVKKYTEQKYARFHMPGHKGKTILGTEQYDITEIVGADSLYQASGIIAESERNASELFGSYKTLYSAEGSSLCIRSMLYLIANYAQNNGSKPLIVATRNAHKVFALTTALLNINVAWISSENESDTLCSAKITPQGLDSALSTLQTPPTAVYVTSPDYLGNMLDIAGLAKVAHKHHCLLVVDNAHGAYLKFVDGMRHPMDCGADMCCDSAHKTLPALTGAAYLHIGKSAPAFFAENARDAMGMFGSTSPSYLILQSLDKLNGLLFDGY